MWHKGEIRYFSVKFSVYGKGLHVYTTSGIDKNSYPNAHICKYIHIPMGLNRYIFLVPMPFFTNMNQL